MSSSEDTESVRLSARELDAIRAAIYRLDKDAKIFLFGSRADPSAKGGDIDLLILSDRVTVDDRLDILAELFQTIEEQKIDIVIAKDTSDPFVSIAMESGRKL